jgi:hypothetical protein
MVVLIHQLNGRARPFRTRSRKKFLSAAASLGRRQINSIIYIQETTAL